MPAKVLAAVATKGHSPPVPWKPAVGRGGWTVSSCTRARIKGVEVAFYPGGVDKKMSARRSYAKKPVRVGDKASAGKALIDFGSVTANSAQRSEKAEHINFQRKAG